jgi:SAM-dependent methyltransferase
MGILDVVKAHTPWAIRRVSRNIKRQMRWARNARQPVGKIFGEVYQNNLWGGEQGSFYSGPGSTADAAARYAEGISDFIRDRGIRSIVDLGCGDFRVARMFVNDAISYTGVDIVEPLVRENIARFRSDNIDFRHVDIINDRLPEGELALVREVFQHLSNAQIQQILPKLRHFRYAVYTDYQPGPGAPCTPNRDIPHGVDTRIWRDSALFLDQPPFNVPMRLLFEAPASSVLMHPGERIRTFLLWP